MVPGRVSILPALVLAAAGAAAQGPGLTRVYLTVAASERRWPRPLRREE